MKRRSFSEVPHGELAPDLLQTAQNIRRQAHAPYSKFKVGAALLTRTGTMFVGCNLEYKDYNGPHAPESALAAMVASGARAPVMLAVLGGLEGGAKGAILPCRRCCQKLSEVTASSGYDLDVIVWDGRDGLVPQLVKLSALLSVSLNDAETCLKYEHR